MKSKLSEFREEIGRLERMAAIFRDVGMAGKAREYEFLIGNLWLRFDKLELQCFEGEDLTLHE